MSDRAFTYYLGLCLFFLFAFTGRGLQAGRETSHGEWTRPREGMMAKERFQARWGHNEPPQLTIDARDSSFIPTVREYIRILGARLDIEPEERAKELEKLDALVARARHYQEDNAIIKKTLRLKRPARQSP